MLEQRNSGGMIRKALKVLKSIQLLLMVSVRLFLNKLIFFQIPLRALTLFLQNQTNLVTESRVHPLLHTNCHRQIVFAKFNLKIEYPPIYERVIWNHKITEEQLINHAIKSLN